MPLWGSFWTLLLVSATAEDSLFDSWSLRHTLHFWHLCRLRSLRSWLLTQWCSGADFVASKAAIDSGFGFKSTTMTIVFRSNSSCPKIPLRFRCRRPSLYAWPSCCCLCFSWPNRRSWSAWPSACVFSHCDPAHCADTRPLGWSHCFALCASHSNLRLSPSSSQLQLR